MTIQLFIFWLRKCISYLYEQLSPNTWATRQLICILYHLCTLTDNFSNAPVLFMFSLCKWQAIRSTIQVKTNGCNFLIIYSTLQQNIHITDTTNNVFFIYKLFKYCKMFKRHQINTVTEQMYSYQQLKHINFFNTIM